MSETPAPATSDHDANTTGTEGAAEAHRAPPKRYSATLTETALDGRHQYFRVLDSRPHGADWLRVNGDSPDFKIVEHAFYNQRTLGFSISTKLFPCPFGGKAVDIFNVRVGA